MFKNISFIAYKQLYLKRFLVLISIFPIIIGCVKSTDLTGYTFKSEDLTQIHAGRTTSDLVLNILGTPSTISEYGDKVWYYVSREYERVAFLNPKIKNQKIIAITFNKKDIVESIKEYSTEDAREVKIARDITKTEGHDIGVIGQLLGNVGRFNSEPGRAKIKKPRNTPK